MKQSEKILTVCVLGAIGIGLGAQLLPEDFSLAGGMSGLASGEFDGARDSFQRNYATLKIGPDIRTRFARVDTQFPETKANQTPDTTFSGEVERMLKDRGWSVPNIKVPERDEIDDVDDYYYIDLQIDRLPCDPKRMIDLLVDFQKQGVLIKKFNATRARNNPSMLILNLTVSRLARLSEEEKIDRARREKNKRRRGRR